MSRRISARVRATTSCVLASATRRSRGLGNVKLLPRCRVEAFIKTYDRTVISYFAKPLHDQILQAFREGVTQQVKVPVWAGLFRRAGDLDSCGMMNYNFHQSTVS